MLILIGLLTFAAGSLAAELFLTRLSIVVVAAGTILFLWGPAHLKHLAFPLALLPLMVPLPALIFNQIAFPLQLVASRLGETTLAAAGIPVLRDGNVLELPNITLAVAEACSGIRSLISLITLAIVLAYFTERRPIGRAVIILSAVPIAIVANAFRVAGTGFTSHWLGPRIAEGFFHGFSGWLVFAVAFAGLLATQRVVRRIPGAGWIVGTARRHGAEMFARAVIVAVLCLTTGAVVQRAAIREPYVSRAPLGEMPLQIDEWRGHDAAPLPDDVVATLGVDDYVNRRYERQGVPVSMYIGYYGEPAQRGHDSFTAELPAGSWVAAGGVRP